MKFSLAMTNLPCGTYGKVFGSDWSVIGLTVDTTATERTLKRASEPHSGQPE